MKKSFAQYKQYIWLICYLIATSIAFLFGFNPGKEIFVNFTDYLIEMIAFIPFLFIIIGLFDAWFPKSVIEKHVGRESGLKGILLVVVLAMLQAGPLYGAFPVAAILHKKGASIRNIFIYLGAFSSMKIPMLGIEIGYLGIKFTLIRTLVSLPLFIFIGFVIERYLKDRNFQIKQP